MTGIELIAAERKRQIAQEGYDPQHDRVHTGFELATAAACYAVAGRKPKIRVLRKGKDAWPWNEDWDKRGKHSYPWRLVIAGALIAAELDRIAELGVKP